MGDRARAFLSKMSGQQFQPVAESRFSSHDGQFVIYVGQTGPARKLLQRQPPGADEFVLWGGADAGRLIIAGHDTPYDPKAEVKRQRERPTCLEGVGSRGSLGTCRGVWHVLRACSGVRWHHRVGFCDSGQWVWSGHTFACPSKLAAKAGHTDMLTMREGKRTPGDLCLNAPGLAEFLAGQAAAEFEKESWAAGSSYPVMPNDGWDARRICQCDRCKASRAEGLRLLEEENQAGRMWSCRKNTSHNVWPLVARVAELAEQMHRPPTYRCKPAAPKLDGVLEDVCWAGAQPMKFHVTLDIPERGGFSDTLGRRCKIVCGGEDLYLGVRVGTHAGTPKAAKWRKNPYVGPGKRYEQFEAIFCNRKGHRYVLTVKGNGQARGQLYAKATARPSDVSTVKVAHKRRSGQSVIELRLPASRLGLQGAPETWSGWKVNARIVSTREIESPRIMTKPFIQFRRRRSRCLLAWQPDERRKFAGPTRRSTTGSWFSSGPPPAFGRRAGPGPDSL